ncbi:hypothetical protein DKY63_13205 [Pseudomonas putida]|uniref:Uncharacterized protein n=2 Tax=Pseudomonas putida TaxID=303 RepID=A0A2Z4RIA1_PSEPU|nr:hypothetical protein DKY63_13205 [Pseudomonas putida]
MPQSSQIIGVNPVTNIELDKGVLPAPIIRNADWFGKLARILAFGRVRRLAGVAYLSVWQACSIVVPSLYRIVANCRFARGSRIEGGI